MDELTQNLIAFWTKGGDLGFFVLGFLWFMFYAGRWYIIHTSHAFAVLANRHDNWYRFFAGWRPKRVWTPFPPAFIVLGLVAIFTRNQFEPWAIANPKPFIGIHGGLLLAGFLAVLILWDREPKHVQDAKGRANSKWRDVTQDWGRTFRDSAGRKITDKHPTAAIAVYRDPSKDAARGALTGQRIKRNLTLVQLRWDIVSGHILILGAQGSGKTTTIYSHVMHSAHCPWIYQDSKAELPWRGSFPDRPVWGLDMRGHQTRSAVWNPLQEARTSEDLDLLVDYIFPIRSQDANPWVRDLARTMFRAILLSKRWASIQEIGRTLKATTLDQFLGSLPPIWQNLMSEPKSQVPVIQDLVVTLERWCTPRVAAITEGTSTVCLDDYLKRGGYLMNSEMSDDLRAPVHLFWAMLLGRIRNRAENSSRILLLMDEFGDAGRIPNIEQALILLRSKGVGIIAGVQNLGILEKVYRHDTKAVVKGFGAKIFLARRLDDEYREQLTRYVGKFTIRFRPSGAKQDQEREVDLLPPSEWGTWSEEAAALSRIDGWTYWLPISVHTPETPFGPPMEDADPWMQEAPKDVEPLPSDWSSNLPDPPKPTAPDTEETQDDGSSALDL